MNDSTPPGVLKVNALLNEPKKALNKESIAASNPTMLKSVPEAVETEIDQDPLWYKDAIIYQLHIKAFCDSNNDGIGDFKGLTSKLDYIQDLGVNTLWLLPFYPSPLRDDGYDIADYRNVHPSYGTIEDFREFVEEAHRRGLRVITELVINHTSDQHPWFQAARNAPAGSPERDFYVWNDDDQKWPETRIIFSDTETSNWAWDPVAKQYYWHRFFSHQPDLNFDNAAVLEAVIDTMYFWLDMGVDGLRLDAVPYLVERDGTSNENNPETHDIIKLIRKALDERYPDRLLLGEANMWPEDVLPYFGTGDECHMAFHFPLMPRIYMGVAQEDRHPIVDIMRQTPEIPENCQWATFLRNHDELTLEMVSDRERDYMWNFYASDRRARINFGIRRRLAPLMENDRRRIELLNSLLMSMPGTPVLYYGDEIGMGDNFFLGDRNGVRTPMQWTPDRNGGFSLADPNYLYLPTIQDPIYGFQSLNVESQRRTRNSLLNWMRQLIQAVIARKSFSRGSLRFFQPVNRKVLAYVREYEGERVLCVANLSRSSQPCELDLKEFNGLRPIELFGECRFPKIGELPYFLTLPAYGFYWFQLVDEGASVTEDESLPDLMTLVIPKGWDSVMHGRPKESLEQQILPAILMKERWYGAKAAGLPDVTIGHSFETPEGRRLVLLTATPPGGVDAPRLCLMAWNIAWESMTDDPFQRYQRCALARVRQQARIGILHEASLEDALTRELLRGFTSAEKTMLNDGQAMLRFLPSDAWPEDDLTELPIKAMEGEQSNTSIMVGDKLILKLIRQPQAGIHSEAEIGRFFTEESPFANTPALYGTIEAVGLGDEPITIGVVQAMVQNQGDGWKTTLDYLSRSLEEHSLMTDEELQQESPEDRHSYYNNLAHQLGLRTGEMHQALAKVTGNGDFDPEPISDADRAAWTAEARELVGRALDSLRKVEDKLTPEAKALSGTILAKRNAIEDHIAQLLPKGLKSHKTRLHGDYHLGQVLLAKNDFYIIDFEGEPGRDLAERRRKLSPLTDVAGMLRSFDYAAASSLKRVLPAFDKPERLRHGVIQWRDEAVRSFMEGYTSVIKQDAEAQAEMTRLIDFYLLEKACYEILYEAGNRPDWMDIPLTGLMHLIKEIGL